MTAPFTCSLFSQERIEESSVSSHCFTFPGWDLYFKRCSWTDVTFLLGSCSQGLNTDIFNSLCYARLPLPWSSLQALLGAGGPEQCLRWGLSKTLGNGIFISLSWIKISFDISYEYICPFQILVTMMTHRIQLWYQHIRKQKSYFLWLPSDDMVKKI